MIKLSIIIVNYNVRYFLEQCILSLKDATKNISSEIIVVDNNSSDSSCEMLHNNFPEVHLINNLINVGFSKANNQGVEKAKGEFVLILNPDTIVPEDIFEKVFPFFEQTDNIGALGVKFINGLGDFLPECKRNIPTVAIAKQKMLGNSKKYYASHIEENENAQVEILTGAFMLLERKTYLNIGGFDEEYFMYGEDIDLSYRLLKSGLKNFYYGASTIIHFKGESTIKSITQIKNFYGAMQIFYRKNFDKNGFHKLASKLFFKILVLLKSLKKNQNVSITSLKNNMLYLGDSIKKLELVREKVKFKKSEMAQVISGKTMDLNLIIFDNSHLSNKTIIEKFQANQLRNVSKRIIPRNTNYFIGSDSSEGRGEVVCF